MGNSVPETGHIHISLLVLIESSRERPEKRQDECASHRHVYHRRRLDCGPDVTPQRESEDGEYEDTEAKTRNQSATEGRRKEPDECASGDQPKPVEPREKEPEEGCDGEPCDLITRLVSDGPDRRTQPLRLYRSSPSSWPGTRTRTTATGTRAARRPRASTASGPAGAHDDPSPKLTSTSPGCVFSISFCSPSVHMRSWSS